MFRIDKSRFNADELAQYEALIAKGMVEDEPETDPEIEIPVVEDTPAEPPVQKSAEPDPRLTAALAQLETLKKSIEMKEHTEIAKKYVPLGYKEEELAKTLYDMKEANPANYNAYIAVLEKSLEIQNQAGTFAEIGKSAGSYPVANSATEKAESRANEIMKADPTIGYAEAIAKAWEDPALMAEYDAEYFKRK